MGPSVLHNVSVSSDGQRLFAAADGGDREAQFAIGWLLLRCLEAFTDDAVTGADPPDWGLARRWLAPAAEAGHVEAQFELGVLLADRRSPADLEGARSWFTSAATVGHVSAQVHLGALLGYRLDPPDLDGARSWWTRAVDDHLRRDLVAYNLGILLADDFDPPDVDGARFWFTQAAEAGHPAAQDRLDGLSNGPPGGPLR